MDSTAETSFEFTVGGCHLDAALGVDLGDASRQRVQFLGGVDVDVRLCVASLFERFDLLQQLCDLSLQLLDLAVPGLCRCGNARTRKGGADGNGKNGMTHDVIPGGW